MHLPSPLVGVVPPLPAGQAHFIKTVEDLAEALFQSGTAIKFGVAFCEASGDRKIRWGGRPSLAPARLLGRCVWPLGAAQR